MPIYITQGRYTREAIKGTMVQPEYRAEAVPRPLAKAGGRLLGYCLTLRDYDFISIAVIPSDLQAASVPLAAANSGGVTDLRTRMAMSAVEAKGAFAAASDLAPSFKLAGGA